MESKSLENLPAPNQQYKVAVLPNTNYATSRSLTVVTPITPRQTVHQVNFPVQRIATLPSTPTNSQPGGLVPANNKILNKRVNLKMMIPLENSVRLVKPTPQEAKDPQPTMKFTLKNSSPSLLKLYGTNQNHKHIHKDNQVVTTISPVPRTLVTFTGTIGAISSSRAITSAQSNGTPEQRPTTKAHHPLLGHVAATNSPILIQRKTMPVKDLSSVRQSHPQGELKVPIHGNSVIIVPHKKQPEGKQLNDTVQTGSTVKLIQQRNNTDAVTETPTNSPRTILTLPYIQLKKDPKKKLLVVNSADNSKSVLIRNPVMSVPQPTSSPKSNMAKVVDLNAIHRQGHIIVNAPIKNATPKDVVVHMTPEVTLIRKTRDASNVTSAHHYDQKICSNGVVKGNECTNSSLMNTPIVDGQGDNCGNQREQRIQSLDHIESNAESNLKSTVASERRFSEPVKEPNVNSQSYDLKRLQCTETIAPSLEENVHLSGANLLPKQKDFVLPKIKKERVEDECAKKPVNTDNRDKHNTSSTNGQVNGTEKSKKIEPVTKDRSRKGNKTSENSTASSNSIITARSTILCTSIMEISKTLQEEKQLKQAVSVANTAPAAVASASAAASSSVVTTEKLVSDSDDDVTLLLPTVCEPIEIDDDDSVVSNPVVPKKDVKMNNCNNATVNNCVNNTKNQSQAKMTNSVPNHFTSKIKHDSPQFKLNSLKEGGKRETERLRNDSTKDVEAIANCGMLKWRNRIGVPRGSNLRFELNEFNLIQIYERCPQRNETIIQYDKPLLERDTKPRNQDEQSEQSPLLYLCRRCNCHGPATDFLAPEFCSVACLKRNSRKRSKEQRLSDQGKRIRKDSSTECMAAPLSLFQNPIPLTANNFQVGMKVEAIDPENLSLFCVCTVLEKKGYRLKLHFDGFDSIYDFWVNADSLDIFPPGWCEMTNRTLQPPKNFTDNEFNWDNYLSMEKAVAAPENLFAHLNKKSSSMTNRFQVGMHLEAEDLNDSGKLCVATVVDVIDQRIRVHFDGWDDCYDIIVDINSPYIHPCGWHVGRQQLIVPPEHENKTFNWDDYIKEQGRGLVATADLFTPRAPNYFRTNMKLEVVDPRNSSLIRKATVITHKAHRVKLYLDEWSPEHCFWLEDDSCDLHPVGWCEATGHELEPLPNARNVSNVSSCPINGCRGLGNAIYSDQSTHSNRNCCPYWLGNWRLIPEKPKRLPYEQVIHGKDSTSTQQTNEQSSPNHSEHHKQGMLLHRLNGIDNTTTYDVQNDDIRGHITESLPIPAGDSVAQPMDSSTNATDEFQLPGINIAQEFLKDYGPRLRQNYELWRSHFNINPSKIHTNPLYWTSMETSNFVKQIVNCDVTAGRFLHEDIDGTAFLLLQQNDLIELLSIKMGPAVKLHSAILQLRILAITKFNVTYNYLKGKGHRYPNSKYNVAD